MSTLGLRATGDALRAIDQRVPQLVEDRVASRLAAQDPTLWGSAAEPEAAQRLGWMDPIGRARDLVPVIEGLREELTAEGVRRVVLAGMGGSSLAPEVIAATSGHALTVLDSTDPEMVGNVLAAGVQDTVLVVASKSGSTLETDSQRRVFEQAFTDAGLDAGSRIVVVTDPGSPLEKQARADGYRHVFTADPAVGGRYSALTAFGIVPTGLAGVDIGALLDEAEETLEVLSADEDDNPGLRLGAALAGTEPLRNKLVVSDEASGLAGFGSWAEQLIAESTGKEGTGILPVVVDAGDPETTSTAGDLLQVRLVADPEDRDGRGDLEDDGVGGDRGGDLHGVEVHGGLGSQFVLWEFATAVAGRLLGINPFDQPDVEAAKSAARELLDGPGAASTPGTEDDPGTVIGDVTARGPAAVVQAGEGDATARLTALLDAVAGLVPEHGYLAVQAYLDRLGYTELEVLRDALARRSGRPVTFGWGPRFLHSTGQYHKGGPREGVFLQVTADSDVDLEIPGRPFTFGGLIAAQAAGDAAVLRATGQPVVRLHLTDRSAGVGELLQAAHGMNGPDA